MYQTGKNMLCGMLLHIIKPVGPVNFSVNLLSYNKRLCKRMGNDVLFNLDIHNLHPINDSLIRALSSLFREKESLI